MLNLAADASTAATKNKARQLSFVESWFAALTLCLTVAVGPALSQNASDHHPLANITSQNHHFVNQLIPSIGYTYGYAPSIIYQDKKFHMFFCSSPDGSSMDF